MCDGQVFDVGEWGIGNYLFVVVGQVIYYYLLFVYCYFGGFCGGGVCDSCLLCSNLLQVLVLERLI